MRDDPSRAIVVLAALDEELAPLRRGLPAQSASYIRTGVGPRRAAEAVRQRCPAAKLVISTGCCGGLVLGAPAGMLCIPRQILRLAADGHVAAAPAPDAALGELARTVAEQAGLPCSSRPLLSVEHALFTAESKRACQERSGAVAVDMETAAIAEVAAELGIRYVAIRVVLDTANENLPDLPLWDAQGQFRPAGIVRAVQQPRAAVTLASLALRLRGVSGNLVRCIGGLLSGAAD